MSEIYIVQGDLETLSTNISNVAGGIGGVDIDSALTSISGAMQGASSPGTAVSTAQTIDDGISKVKSCYDDLADDVLKAANQFQASDSQTAETFLGSAGVLEPEDPGYYPTSKTSGSTVTGKPATPAPSTDSSAGSTTWIKPDLQLSSHEPINRDSARAHHPV